jgi:type I restriction enzyme, R subunit
MMLFNDELQFEKEVISLLTRYGWEKDVLFNPTEKDLIENWKRILYQNNSQIDRLNKQELTDSEMQQILEQIKTLRSPLRLNSFINGKTVSIKRDNPNDPQHLGKEISLKIYDRLEIAAGQSRYQIVSQPRFSTPGLYNDRRGDILLLINGMPVIHIELKKTGIPVLQAANQIEKYSKEGVFRGLFSLVQVFVAMNPEESLYFANPGEDNKFNPNYYFHWADFNNEQINDWQRVVSTLLSIPMAHQLIGFYTVADASDGLLKVLRSYQYYAAHAISDKVAKTDWSLKNKLGGYIWHTTGSGKTMTSFKSAQLIAASKDADKVIFLVDRIELGTQSLREYRNFASDYEEVQATENTRVLVSKLKSKLPDDTLIVTSIQKMSNIGSDEDGLNKNDIEKIQSKRTVIIVDEAHRSTFGDMLNQIKKTFSEAIFFGFTGTPIHRENDHKDSTTSDVFGDELHRYSIADGIRDNNVLGFDPYKVLTYKDSDLRKSVALEKAKAKTEAEAVSNEQKSQVYYQYLQTTPMAGTIDKDGKKVLGIEDYIPTSQYNNPIHREKVFQDITDNWVGLSRNGKFHAILATSSIQEAIEYYRLFKNANRSIIATCLVDPTIDNEGDVSFKQEGLVELLEDYNTTFGQSYSLGTWNNFKRDVASRLAHKAPYISIDKSPEKQVNLLIVVNQMLTGFDSKWVNTLYIDKMLEYEMVIQAFSRTNRLFGPDKPFGTIKYYRKSHTMEKNIERAIKLYSGDKPFGLFVPKLEEHLAKLQSVYQEIYHLFDHYGDTSYTSLPEDPSARAKFSKLFKEFSNVLEAAKIQGFQWAVIQVGDQELNENIYLTLALRYKELSTSKTGSTTNLPYDIEGYLTEIDTGLIDTNYMNSNFVKYLKALEHGSTDEQNKTKNELHHSFATLSQEEQKFAYLFLHDIERGEAKLVEEKSLRDYITDYRVRNKNDQIQQFADIFGFDVAKLKAVMNLDKYKEKPDEFGRLHSIKNSFDLDKAKKYFESTTSEILSDFQVHIKFASFLNEFISQGGFNL